MSKNVNIPSTMCALEKRAALGLAGIFSVRMLGLFMLLPVMSLYADELIDATPILLGLAISIYGLTQALMQIPFGLMSDRLGRKNIITVGLIFFAAGSVVAATSDSIYGVIIGRALQGSGAVAAAVMALAADLTHEQNRTKIMATIGISIGISFGLAMVLGPLVSSFTGLQGIFWLTAALAFIALIILYQVVPNPVAITVHKDAEPVPKLMGKVLKDGELLRLDFGIFCLHLVMTAIFVVIPLVFRDVLGVEAANHWMIYLPILGLSVVAMVPFIIIAEKKRKMKTIFVGAVGTITLASLAMFLGYESFWGLLFSLFVFFTAFNLLEATLPSLISKIAFAGGKGTAMGVYSSAQFFGAFCGGVMGGTIYQYVGLAEVLLVCSGVLALWFIAAFGMQAPRHLSSILKPVTIQNEDEAAVFKEQLFSIEGVVEVAVSADDATAYLKVDNQEIDQNKLDKAFQKIAN